MNETLYLIVGEAPFIVDPLAAQFRHLYLPDYRAGWSTFSREGDFFLGTLRTGPDQEVPVKIPEDVLLKNAALSDWARIGINCRSEDEHWGFILGDEQLAMRLCGKLPHIDLAGTDFTVDWRLRELRDTENPWNHLSFDDMEMGPEGDSYHFFYNTASRELLVPDIYLEKIPDDLVQLTIPGELQLDPVAVAREYGVEPAGLLIRHPYSEKLTARVLPVSDTGLPAYVESNIQMRSSKRTRSNRR